MIEKLINSLKGQKEPLELKDVSGADSLLEEEKREQLESIQETFSEIKQDTEEIIEDLLDSLEDLEGFEDSKRRTVIEDVVSNIVEERKELLEDFELKEDPDEFQSELSETIEDFRSMSQKEAAVMEEAYLKNHFSEELGRLDSKMEELEEFINGSYSLKKSIEEIKEKKKERERTLKEIKELEEKVEHIEPDDSENEIKDKKRALEILESSSLESDYRQKSDLMKQKEEEITGKKKQVGKSISKMQRGLKKLIYEGVISGISRKESKILREIRDGEKDKILERNPGKISTAVESVESSLEEEMIEESTRIKLLNGIEVLKNSEELFENISDLENEVGELREIIESHRYIEKKKELEKEISKLEKRLKELNEEKEMFQERMGDKKQKVESLETEIVELMEQELGREVDWINE